MKAKKKLPPPAPDLPRNSLDLVDQDAVRLCAQRAESHGAQFDQALLQTLRERLWSALAESCEPKTIREIFPHIAAGRRQDLAERKMQAAENQKYLSAEEAQLEIERVFGQGVSHLSMATEERTNSSDAGNSESAHAN